MKLQSKAKNVHQNVVQPHNVLAAVEVFLKGHFGGSQEAPHNCLTHQCESADLIFLVRLLLSMASQIELHEWNHFNI